MRDFSWYDWRADLQRRIQEEGTTSVDQAPLTRADLVIKRIYSRRQIHQALGGGVQEYLPHVGGKVVCGCFTSAVSPHAPEVVLSGSGPNIRRWAETFAQQRNAVPIFLKRQSRGAWVYVGDYFVKELVTDAQRAEQIGQAQGRTGVRLVLYLQVAETPAGL